MKKNMQKLIKQQGLISVSWCFIFLFLANSLVAQETNTIKAEDTIIEPIMDFYFTTEEIDAFKTAVYKTGDRHAYLQLLMSKGRRSEETLAYSLIMANKFHYLHAYYDVYVTIIDIADTYSTELDSTTVRIALKYLQEGATAGDISCVYEISRLYLNGKYVKQDENIAKSYFAILYADNDFEYRWRMFVQAYTIQNKREQN